MLLGDAGCLPANARNSLNKVAALQHKVFFDRCLIATRVSPPRLAARSATISWTGVPGCLACWNDGRVALAIAIAIAAAGVVEVVGLEMALALI